MLFGQSTFSKAAVNKAWYLQIVDGMIQSEAQSAYALPSASGQWLPWAANRDGSPRDLLARQCKSHPPASELRFVGRRSFRFNANL